MSGDIEQVTVDGQGLQASDLNSPFRQAALSDDVVLAELFRLAPFNGTSVAKAILPYAVTGSNTPMVAPYGATGSVFLNPFRVVVGSRTAVSATAGSPLTNWHDVRTRINAVTEDNATLGQPVAFIANSSGSPRWDVVYVSIQVDQNSPTVTRNVTAPNTTTPVADSSIVPSLTQILTVGVQEGTPAASPDVPALPADTVTATGTYYVPIAAVLIPNGFSGTTTVLSEWIKMLAPMAPITTALGGVDSRPPNYLSQNLPASANETWGSSGTRPDVAIPCTRIGGVRRRFGFDATTSSPLLGDTVVLDDQIDWRNRDFEVRCYAKAGATQFAWQPGASSGAVPMAGAGSTILHQEGQSFVDDSAAILGVSSRNAGVVFFANNANFAPIASGSNAFGLYVDLTSGHLHVFYQGTPGCLLVLTIDATAPFDNV